MRKFLICFHLRDFILVCFLMEIVRPRIKSSRAAQAVEHEEIIDESKQDKLEQRQHEANERVEKDNLFIDFQGFDPGSFITRPVTAEVAQKSHNSEISHVFDNEPGLSSNLEVLQPPVLPDVIRPCPEDSYQYLSMLVGADKNISEIIKPASSDRAIFAHSSLRI